MNFTLLRALAFIVVIATAATVEAQSTLHTERDTELQLWMKEFTAWQKWWSEWANRPEPGWIASSRARRAKPDPPAGLAGECEEVFDPTDARAPACALLEDWRTENAVLLTGSSHGTGLLKAETEPKTIWWEHVLLDLMWPATELRLSVFGVVGMHTSMTIKGRAQIFLAPGVMLMNVPTIDGIRVWKIATNYGIGYRLFDFTVPGYQRRASLNVNFAKSWMLSDTVDMLTSRTTDFAGFSITFKRR